MKYPIPRVYLSKSMLLELRSTITAAPARASTKNVLYLSKRNVDALLAKLERAAIGDTSNCAIIKYRQTSLRYRQTAVAVLVTAVPDEEYEQQYEELYKDTLDDLTIIALFDEIFYAAQERKAGEMHPKEEQLLGKPSTGIEPFFQDVQDQAEQAWLT